MRVAANADAASLVEAISAAAGCEVIFNHRFAAGWDGAFDIHFGGQRAVLKLYEPAPGWRERAASIDERQEILRARGVPVPACLWRGPIESVIADIQEFRTGTQPVGVTQALWEASQSILARQRSCAVDGSNWMRALVENGLGLAGVLRSRLKTQTAKECWSISHATLEAADLSIRGPDIVHGDFGPANLLVIEDEITAVVDWGRCQDGDVAYDILGFLWDIYMWDKGGVGLVDRVLTDFLATSDRPVLRVYVAEWLMRCFGWAASTEFETAVATKGLALFDACT